MAQTRRPTHSRSPSSSLSSQSTTRKKYSLRGATARTSNSHAPPPSSFSPTTPPDNRPVLVPLHPNLRRLPSRLFGHKGSDKDMVMRDPDQVIQVGAKRKRVANTNENALANGRPTRHAANRKRLKTTSLTKRRMEYLSDDTDTNMETTSTLSSPSTEDEEESEEEASGSDVEEEEDNELSTDDHLLHFASVKQLARLRKPDLVRLYNLAGLPEDAELFTKHEIIDFLMEAREDYASIPPSSPVGRDGSSSGSLSDDGNVAGGEETDATPIVHMGANGMRRRVTSQDLSKLNGRMPKGRSMSMGNLANLDAMNLGHDYSRKCFDEVRGESSRSTVPKKRTSNQSSPTSSIAPSTARSQSPPATRLRTRKTSGTTSIPIPCTTPTSANSKSSKGKGKPKQVEFSQDLDIKLKTSPSKRRLRERAREREARAKLLEGESDLTDVEEIEDSMRATRLGTTPAQPSPRRLRSKDKQEGRDKTKADVGTLKSLKKPRRKSPADLEEAVVGVRKKKKRVAPARRVKGKVKTLKKMDTQNEVEDEEEEEDQLEEERVEDEIEEERLDGEEEEEESEEEGGEEGEEEEEDVQEEEEEEVDELISSTSTTPPRSRARRTPLKSRLRSRGRNGSAAPDDGDVEDEGEDQSDDDEVEEGEEAEEVEAGEEAEDVEGGDEDAEGESEDETPVVVEPRKLRNGKVVGEDEDVEMETVEEDIGEEDSETGEEEEAEEVETASEIDVDAEGETDEDEVMEEEVDLTVATAKTLVRLRRDDLVRLCETRDLEPVGTKPQLAEALLQWRDRHANEHSSPSSSGTVRPSSTNKKRKRGKVTSSTVTTTPVLLRSEHIHDDEPRTPIPSGKEAEQELELDLESLGLEDREIPPDKLTKLEKIGSGGFKDVFIGKFKGRRVAISEFRGTLSAMDIKELKLLGGFDHPNVVRFLGVSIPENTKETPVMIVSELCSNGDLYDYIRNTNTPSLHKVLSMMLDIARGLEYLHTRNPSVIHRDCKSSNILITARGTAKIADFGLAKVKQSTRSMVKSLVGTVNWQAPELWTAHPKYNHKVDVFSCALVFWEMLQWHLSERKHPWEGMNEHAIYEVVGAKRQRPSLSGLRKQWCPEIVDLMERMWAHEHEDRPTMTEVVKELEEMLANR